MGQGESVPIQEDVREGGGGGVSQHQLQLQQQQHQQLAPHPPATSAPHPPPHVTQVPPTTVPHPNAIVHHVQQQPQHPQPLQALTARVLISSAVVANADNASTTTSTKRSKSNKKNRDQHTNTNGVVATTAANAIAAPVLATVAIPHESSSKVVVAAPPTKGKSRSNKKKVSPTTSTATGGVTVPLPAHSTAAASSTSTEKVMTHADATAAYLDSLLARASTHSAAHRDNISLISAQLHSLHESTRQYEQQRKEFELFVQKQVEMYVELHKKEVEEEERRRRGEEEERRRMMMQVDSTHSAAASVHTMEDDADMIATNAASAISPLSSANKKQRTGDVSSVVPTPKTDVSAAAAAYMTPTLGGGADETPAWLLSSQQQQPQYGTPAFQHMRDQDDDPFASTSGGDDFDPTLQEQMAAEQQMMRDEDEEQQPQPHQQQYEQKEFEPNTLFASPPPSSAAPAAVTLTTTEAITYTTIAPTSMQFDLPPITSSFNDITPYPFSYTPSHHQHPLATTSTTGGGGDCQPGSDGGAGCMPPLFPPPFSEQLKNHAHFSSRSSLSISKTCLESYLNSNVLGMIEKKYQSGVFSMDAVKYHLLMILRALEPVHQDELVEEWEKKMKIDGGVSENASSSDSLPLTPDSSCITRVSLLLKSHKSSLGHTGAGLFAPQDVDNFRTAGCITNQASDLSPQEAAPDDADGVARFRVHLFFKASQPEQVTAAAAGTSGVTTVATTPVHHNKRKKSYDDDEEDEQREAEADHENEMRDTTSTSNSHSPTSTSTSASTGASTHIFSTSASTAAPTFQLTGPLASNSFAYVPVATPCNSAYAPLPSPSAGSTSTSTSVSGSESASKQRATPESNTMSVVGKPASSGSDSGGGVTLASVARTGGGGPERGQPLFRMIHVNRAFERLSGYSQKEMTFVPALGLKKLMQFIRVDHFMAMHAIIMKWRMEHQTEGHMYQVRIAKNGTPTYCLVHVKIHAVRGMVQEAVHSFMPLPASQPVPPFVEGVDLSEETVLYGYRPGESDEASNAATIQAAPTTSDPRQPHRYDAERLIDVIKVATAPPVPGAGYLERLVPSY